MMQIEDGKALKDFNNELEVANPDLFNYK